MRICYLLTRSDTLGGVQIHVKHLSERMVKEGHDSIIIVGGKGSYYRFLNKHGHNVISLEHLRKSLNPYHDFLAFFELIDILKKIKPDLISIHSSKAGVLGRLAASCLNVPSIFTAHGWAFTEGVGLVRQRIYALIEKIMAFFCKKIITVSRYDRKLAIKKGITSDDKLVVIHNGMPNLTNKIYSEVDEEPVKLTMVARFVHQKDHQTLIEALSRIQSTEWSIDLIGRGPLKNFIKKKAQDMNLDSRVNFIGEVEDVVPYLQEAQIFLLISHWEGLPRSIIEAMRSGLPVIATDVAGVNEMVIDGKNGFLIPRKNIDYLPSKLKYLINTPDERIRMRIESLKQYNENFNFEKTFKNTMAIYREMIDLK